MLGPKYAILRDQLLIRENKKGPNDAEKILIMIGGTDKDNLILKILKSLKSFNKKIIYLNMNSYINMSGYRNKF